MKTFLLSHIPANIVSALLLVVITLGNPVQSYANSDSSPKPLPKQPGDSILIVTKKLSRSHKIALYTDAAQQVVFFNVKGDEGRVYHLYMFDMEGNIVKRTEIRNKQTAPIKNIEKGVYLFEVFSDDDKICNGQIAVK